MNRRLACVGVPIVAVWASGAALAQEAKPPAPPPTQPQPARPQPSLDELLGLPKDKPAAVKPSAKPRPEAADPTRTELDRKLSDQEVSEKFAQAIELMGETAERLQAAKDTGLATQRLQEDIIRKLDQLIKAAEQNKQQSKSRSKSSQGDQNKQQPDQQQSQRNPDGKEAAPDTMDPPAGQAAAPNPGAAARGAAWGALPGRIRDALTQGNTDKYSAVWEKWTEAYYRRLAEDASK